MRRTSAFPVVVSGPSGAGKTTLAESLVERDPLLRNSVSVTTRAPREGEVKGESYFFVKKAAFDKLRQDGKLVEWATVHDHQYGTPHDFVEKELAGGRDVLLNIDVQGGAQVKKRFPMAVLIFILPPSFQALGERIERRGTDYAAEVEKRLANAREEIKFADEYEYLVVNDDFEEAVSKLQAIIESERTRRSRFPNDFIDQILEGD